MWRGRAEPVTGVITDHGEGIGWHAALGAVRLVDMLAGDLVTLRADGSTERVHLAPVVAAWRERAAGGTVVALERGFALLDADDALEWSAEVWTDPGLRMNEGACDPQGRFYCGSMAYDAAPGAGALWRLDPDCSVTLVREGLTIANGLVWSADGSEALHIDTPTQRVDAYRFDADAGTLTPGRVAARVEGGGPDGMCADADGGLWVALWGGSAVHRYDGAGALTHVLEIGARQVTSCAFGGADLDTLYVTTSRHGLEPGEDPLAGAVFAARVGVRGRPLDVFAG